MTSTVEIRHVPYDDITPWLRSMRTTLLVDPGAGSSEQALAWWREVWDPDRIFGGYAEGRCVATLTIPVGPAACAELPVDALTQVTVAATHRRQGLLTRMLTQSLADAKERGEVASFLKAAEWQIYGRFGYWPAVQGTNYRILSGQRPRVLPPRTPYQLVGADPEQLAEPATDVHRRVRLRQAGHIARTGADCDAGWAWAGCGRPARVSRSACWPATPMAGWTATPAGGPTTATGSTTRTRPRPASMRRWPPPTTPTGRCGATCSASTWCGC
jgi:GNAT superfamily N-acetyltransferase